MYMVQFTSSASILRRFGKASGWLFCIKPISSSLTLQRSLYASAAFFTLKPKEPENGQSNDESQ